MRELILKMSMSLDGFVGDEEGTNTWLYGSDTESRAWAVHTIWNASLHIMGSRSFQAWASFWPASTMEFAPPMNQIPKAVFSKQGTAVLKAAAATADLPGGQSWAEAYVATGDLAQEIAQLKGGSGKPILAHGGVRFARSLIAAGLVDQFVLGVLPIALGRGQPLFADLPAPQRFQLVSSSAFPGGVMAQVYRPA